MLHSHLGLIYLKIFHKGKTISIYFINTINCILHYLYMVLHPFRYGMSAGNINRILRGLASRLTTQFQRDEVSHRPRNLNCPIPILKEIIRKGI